MGRRLAGWRALPWRERGILLACMAGLGCTHLALARFGYVRTRRAIEALTNAKARRAASDVEITSAQAMARLAAIAGRHGAVEASCLRQSLLLYGWLRRRGLDPSLHLGIRDGGREAFQAHAWVELGGARLLPGDAGHRPFHAHTPQNK
jgi:hypothetical protein